MNENLTISRVYFIGIGGIGMSALAKYFLQKGMAVSGYDKTSSSITTQLIGEGAAIHFVDDVALLDKKADLVVYTPAIPKEHKELVWYREHNFNLKKRSELLAEITRDGYNICIAGTHGKTTISVMTAFLLKETGFGCNAYLGGVSVNFNTNYWSSSNQVNVIEADEYDRSFLRLSPDTAVITAMDADHLDIYGDVATMRDAFHAFAMKTRKDGVLYTRFPLPSPRGFSATHYRYSLQNTTADIYADRIVMKEGGYTFNVNGPDWSVTDLHLHMGGMHNVENAVVAVSIAQQLGIEEEKIRMALTEFKGVKRRFEYVINPKEAATHKNNVVFIDDYAHHPEELRALLRSARSLFNNRWMTVIFQPHLYSRTRDLYKDFAEVLEIANSIVLMPIYPARELPIEGITAELIRKEIKNERVQILDKDEVLQWLSNEYLPKAPHSLDGDVLITAGAGDIDRLVQPIKERILNDQMDASA